MGCSASTLAVEEAGISKRIDEKLEVERKEVSEQFKILLLGAGEGGKSTIVKQIRIIYGTGYSVSDRMHYRRIIHSNAIHSLFSIIGAMEKLQIKFTDQSRIQDVKRLSEMIENEAITQEVGKIMFVLWNDDAVKACYVRSKEYQLNDSAGHFLNSLPRISQHGYIPSEEDVLKSRVRTTGVVETKFFCKNSLFTMVDVGGQRAQRKKWLHCFDNVTAVIFCASLSEYDIFLEEDCEVNRMKDSMELFDSISKSRWFSEKPLVLFLNKTDILRAKIQRNPLTICFPNYVGPNTYEAAVAYIETKFTSLRQENPKDLYVHLTCAIDTQNIGWVLEVVSDIIIKINQLQCGIF